MKKLIFASALCALAFSACQEEDFDVNKQTIYEQGYNEAFINKFGAPGADENWDFTRAMSEYESVADEDGWYYVEDQTLSWMKEKLPESTDNRSVVSSFSLNAMKGEVFEIIPIYQGQAGLSWDLYAVVNGVEMRLWSKGNIQQKAKWNSDWANVGTGNSQSAYAVRSEPILSTNVFDITEDNTTIYFELVVTVASGNYGKVGDKLTSISDPSQICLLQDCPSTINEDHPDYDVMIIGCEDTPVNGGYSDMDYNDVVFLLTGFVPQPIIENRQIVTSTSKRYMIEDCGTIDFDFNDVVVDVTRTESAWYKINTETGESTIIEGDTNKPHTITTTAQIAHLGGTYPIQVKVGDTSFPRITDPTDETQTLAELAGTEGTSTHSHIKNVGWEPKADPITVDGWDPEKNNISVNVWRDFDLSADPASPGVFVVEFPKVAAVPYIVATPIDAEWTAEGVSVSTTSWWPY